MNNIVYVKTENGIFKCYKSEQMNKPIYHPVNSNTNGYIEYEDVIKVLTIDDLFEENQELKKEIKGYEQERNNLINSVPFKENKRLKKQQKEFIEWLDTKSKKVIRDTGYHQRICLEILEKYKEIIGGDNK